MKKLANTFLNMMYPMLISLFLFIFSESFLNGGSREVLQAITAILAVFFGILFLVGFISTIVCAIKSRESKS